MITTSIQTKEDIIQQIQLAYNEVKSYVSKLDNESYNYAPKDRWSVADQLEHLILSSKGIPSALNMPKAQLEAFGRSTTGSRSYEKLFGAYKNVLNTGMKAPAKFSPDKEKPQSKEEILASWQMIETKFSKRLVNWSEAELDSFQLPHPALGVLTIREMLLFTIFHTYHHLRTMKALF
jgi:DinB family protein